MIKLNKLTLLLIGIVLIYFIFFLRPKPPLANLTESLQIILVTATDSNSTIAKLQRYQRINNQAPWVAFDNPIDVVIGKHGMAWHELQSPPKNTPIKKEGDGRTPAGIFSLGTAFGFSDKPDFALKLAYLPISESTVCVDDVNSTFYNSIIDSKNESKSSWNSGEVMREKIPNYFWGVVINYNYPHPIQGDGSCIFMHVWKGPTQGTSGCVAMAEPDVKRVLAWLDPNKKPMLVVIPLNEYNNYKEKWNLPNLT